MSIKVERPDSKETRAAVLVAVQLPGVSDAELASSLDELARLARTLGLIPVARFTQHRPNSGAPNLLGSGKLRELARLTGGSGIVPAGASRRQKGARPAEEDTSVDDDELPLDLDADPEPDEAAEGAEAPPMAEADRAQVVLIDHDLSPSQLRNLEAATSAEVLDRSSVILHIFQRHARTREARLQVEIARLNYLAPRLRVADGGGDRQRGGLAGRGGAGESSIELDRRRVRDRIAELKDELAMVQRGAITQRARRGDQRSIALVGYTNAGKSSLMRALTGAEVLVEDQLFATLDTTVRQLMPASRPSILVSDTVGFIKKLPHDLVASFRSTLEEARHAALLVHVVDAADPAWRSQFEVTRSVLAELGAGDSPALVVLNKADRLNDDERAALAAELPQACVMSALASSDIAGLHARIVSFFEEDMVEEELFVSYRAQRVAHTIHESCRVLAEVHEESGTRFRVRAPRQLIEELRSALRPTPTAS